MEIKAAAVRMSTELHQQFFHAAYIELQGYMGYANRTTGDTTHWYYHVLGERVRISTIRMAAPPSHNAGIRPARGEFPNTSRTSETIRSGFHPTNTFIPWCTILVRS